MLSNHEDMIHFTFGPAWTWIQEILKNRISGHSVMLLMLEIAGKIYFDHLCIDCVIMNSYKKVLKVDTPMIYEGLLSPRLLRRCMESSIT